ncbi:hypothetical protein [Thioalkalivibrio denitrificans]|uniref:hypothetical protein n=1 Tax=Thioalkalivibrio denitrificans TaxID=108003 RepID=UPI0011157D48|nr:hypothetical protein [Thioalkalivibrio denitrificans]
MTEQKGADEIKAVFKIEENKREPVPVNADGAPNMSAVLRACGLRKERLRLTPSLCRGTEASEGKGGLRHLKMMEASVPHLKY